MGWPAAIVCLLLAVPWSLAVTEVYDVGDLVAAKDTEGRAFNDFDSLISAITRTIAGNTWDLRRGPGTIVPFEAPGIAAIVVTHRREAHEAIGRLLTDLRRLRRPDATVPIKNRAPKTEPAVPPNWITKGGVF